MILSIFSSLYEMFLGPNQNNSKEYRDSIFSPVGLLTLVISAIICFIFYIVLGRWKNIWYTRTHWAITILICAIIGYIIAYTIADNVLEESDSYLVLFAFCNAFYAALYFVILSFVFKNFSIYSKRTPL